MSTSARTRSSTETQHERSIDQEFRRFVTYKEKKSRCGPMLRQFAPGRWHIALI